MNSKGKFSPFSFVSLRMRALYGAMTVIIALAEILTYGEYRLSVPGIILVVICALAACYEERWTFDETARCVTFRHGLVFLARAKKYPYREVSGLRIESFEKGFRKTPWTKISLLFKNDMALVIETLPTKKAAKLIGLAESLDSSFKD